MFKSSRFTDVLTQSTRQRLEDAFSNELPLARREPHHGAVIAVQAALCDLNRGYLQAAEVDGYFGTRMAAAVEMFQRDYGLYPDGTVGRQTLGQLDELFSSDTYRKPQGLSIHVGVNRLDEAHYGGKFPLGACENDARAMQEVAKSMGYETILLLTDDATTANFAQAVRQGVTNLFAGDTLMISFSGHGSQLVNTSADIEDDLMDETLCFHDRMLIDDEVAALLSELRPGVQVVAIYDSCHSGTVTRELDLPDSFDTKAREKLLRDLGASALPAVTPAGAAPSARAMPAAPSPAASATPTRSAPTSSPSSSTTRARSTPSTSARALDGGDEAAPAPTLDDLRPIDPRSLESALDGNAPKLTKPAGYEESQLTDAVKLLRGNEEDRRTASGKAIEEHSAIYQRNKALYDTVRNLIGPQPPDDFECQVVALSACQDNQTTLDGAVHGYFTGNLLQIWADGGFVGSYDQLYQRLVKQSTPTITPVVNTYGGPRAAARLQGRPFAL